MQKNNVPSNQLLQTREKKSDITQFNVVKENLIKETNYDINFKTKINKTDDLFAVPNEIIEGEQICKPDFNKDDDSSLNLSSSEDSDEDLGIY